MPNLKYFQKNLNAYHLESAAHINNNTCNFLYFTEFLIFYNLTKTCISCDARFNNFEAINLVRFLEPFLVEVRLI